MGASGSGIYMYVRVFTSCLHILYMSEAVKGLVRTKTIHKFNRPPRTAEPNDKFFHSKDRRGELCRMGGRARQRTGEDWSPVLPQGKCANLVATRLPCAKGLGSMVMSRKSALISYGKAGSKTPHKKYTSSNLTFLRMFTKTWE
ncbi:unnamed protein product [Nesidiocoris tenuis]|uniref:Uncharacterized protein n=1 Tax=Nesidiocoris tenuis TaxID=355587 RepID=A0A6H5H641_9HEMI|nr:unnamed protein product [Nesidiocoris tenuis]